MTSSFFTTWNSFQAEEDFDDEGYKSEEQLFWNVKDCILFAIDCNQDMIQSSGVFSAIQCARAVLENKIISNDSDMIGIVLYNTKKSRNSFSFPNIYVLHDLDQPDATRILELENYEKAQKMSSRRVFLVTNEDHPHAGNSLLLQGAVTRIKDLFDLGIQVELFKMDRPGSKFDISIFYKDLLVGDDDEVATLETESSSKFEELMVRIRRKETKKRPLMKLGFNLGGNVEVAVKVFLLFSEARKGTPVMLDSKTNKEVNSLTEYICKDTGTRLMPTDLLFYYEFGGEKAVFTKDEVLDIKKFENAGLTLLGFKPLERLKPFYNLKHSYFLYPDDSTIKGSAKFISHLIQRLNHLKKIAICRYTARNYSAPRLVALLPQLEQLDEQGVQILSPGLHLIFLPFSDDLRSVPKESSKASVEQIDKAKEIISKLLIQSGYHYEDFENPTIQRFYSTLQALALDRSDLDEVEDNTIPKYEKIDNRIGDIAEQFKKLTLLGEVTAAPKKAPVKRKPKDVKTAVKKLKEAGVEVEENPIDIADKVKTFYAEGKINKLTVMDLKEFLELNEVKPKGKKADLIDMAMKLLA